MTATASDKLSEMSGNLHMIFLNVSQYVTRIERLNFLRKCVLYETFPIPSLFE